MPTIYDVAKACGVAPSTVSRAFSRPGRVNAETAARIRKVAEEIGYRANPLARALPTGKTSLLALVVSDVTNPFYFEIIRGAELAANEADYTLARGGRVRVGGGGAQGARTRAAPRRGGRAGHVAHVGLGDPGDGAAAADRRAQPRADRHPERHHRQRPRDPPGDGAPRATLEHRSIGYVAGPEASWADGMRWRAMREAAEALDAAGAAVRPVRPDARRGDGGRAPSSPTRPSPRSWPTTTSSRSG